MSVVRNRVTAENLARSQLECIKDHPYITGAIPISYTTVCTVTEVSSYPIDVGISYWDSSNFTSNPSADSGMQSITVTVSHSGEALITIEDYKVDR